MIWDSIPSELKTNALWCCWRLTEKGKIPFDVVTGQYAKSNNPETFHSYKEALAKVADYYTFDEKQYALVGATSHGLLQLGDEIYVKVKNADLVKKQLDFHFIRRNE
jgi:exoribonuclease R